MATCFFFLSTTVIATPAASALKPDHPSAFALDASDKISGSIGVVQAFQAIREKNVTALVKAINDFACVNETLSLAVNGEEVKLRLIHVVVLMKEPWAIGVLKIAGARMSAMDSQGKTAAHYASFGAPDFGHVFSFHPYVDSEAAVALLDLLHTEGIDLNAADKDRRTALHYAARAGDTPVISRLLALGASPDPKDALGYTPKQLAIRAGFFKIIPALLTKGGALSGAQYWDYILGAQAGVLAFTVTHPLVTTGLAVAPVALYAGKLLFAAHTKAARKKPRFARSRIEALASQGGLPRTGSYDSLTGASSKPAASTQRASTDAARSGTRVNAALPPALLSAASAAAAAPVDKTVKELRTLIVTLNEARRNNDSDGLNKALSQARAWLEDCLLRRVILDETQAKERTALIGAIKSVSTFASTVPDVRREAHRMLEAHAQKG